MKTVITVSALVLALVVSGCAKAPVSLDPASQRIWQADQAVVVVGNVQDVAIKLNGVKKADGQPVLSDNNTRVVVETTVSTLKVIRARPDGWKIEALTALSEISMRLDAAGKTTLKAYIDAARNILSDL